MSKEIGISNPLEKAFDRVIEYCFQPFDFTKWMVMGFVAWIISMGEEGFGNGINLFTNDYSKITSKLIFGQTKKAANEIKNFIHDTFTTEVIVTTVLISIVVILIFITIWLLVAWLKAKFQFIFLDNIICNRAEIKRPWTEFDPQGTSLFKWNIIFGVISTIILTFLVLLAIGITLKMCWSSLEAEQLLPEGKNGLIIGGVFLFITIITSIALGIVSFIVNKLVVPIMYRDRLTITAAWRKCRPAFSKNRGNIALFIIIYWIVLLAVGSVAGIALIIVMFLTCFFFCLGFIPFVGGYLTATIMIPVTIFYRMFSYEYMMQFKLGDSPAPVAELPEAIQVEPDDPEYFDPKKI